MMLFKKKLTVVTHDGGFHADEVFACATLTLWAEKNNFKLKIIRNRDKAVADKADIVVDVGMEYTSERNRFDHHQKGGAGLHKNGIPYASFGLVWRKYGPMICDSQEIADRVEKYLVMPIDGRDNGVSISITNEFDIVDYKVSSMIESFNYTWMEDLSKNNEQFKKALKFTKDILGREMANVRADLEGEKLTKEAILKQNNPAILILDKYFSWEEMVSQNKDIRLVVYQHKNGKDWCVQSGRNDLEDYNSDRAKLPENWAGLRDGELEKVSGIKGAIFCTNGGWFGVARTKEGALQMAKIALQNLEN